MAFIPKRKKKQNIQNSDNINAQWKIYNSREQFALILNGEDISDRLSIELVEDDMIVFDPETSCYFALKDTENVPENELFEVVGKRTENGIAIISYEGFNSFHLFLNGEIITDSIDSFWINEDIIFWVPALVDYFYLAYSKNPVDNEILIPGKMNNSNNTLWIKLENESFNFYIDGQDFANEMNSSYIGESVLLFHPQTETWYFFPDWENAALNTTFTAGVFDMESDKLWARTGETNYKFYNRGSSIDIDDLKASFCNDDVIIYFKTEGVHYQFIDFRNTELFEPYIPEILPSNTPAVWMKPGDKKFKLFVEGEDLSTDVSPQIMDGNLLMMHEKSKKIYVGMDYNNQVINEFQPAVIMDA